MPPRSRAMMARMTEPRGKSRLRFSLTTLVLLTTITALAITVFLQWREVGPLRDEVRRLRDEVGEISLGDRDKIHAIRVHTPEPLVWKWRVWLPAGRRYRLRSEGGEGAISKAGFPEEGGTMYVEPPADEGEEMWVEYRIKQDRDGDWRGYMRTRSGSVGADNHPWAAEGGRVSTTAGVGASTRVGEADEVLVLARFRTADVDSSTDIPDPADGFMVWIEP